METTCTLNVGGHYVSDEPSEAMLRSSLRGLLDKGADDNPFIVLIRGPNPEESEFYIQVLREFPESNSQDYGFVIECREGSEDRHYQCFPSDGLKGLEEVIEVFISYSNHDDSWQTRFKWQHFTARIDPALTGYGFRLNIGDHDYVNNPDDGVLCYYLQRLVEDGSSDDSFIILTYGPKGCEYYLRVWARVISHGLNAQEYVFQLEYREGSEARHYQCFTSTGDDGLKEVMEAFTNYLHYDDSWKTQFKWERLTALQ